MLFIVLFLGELFLLYWLSQKLTQQLSLSLYRFTHSKKLMIYLLAFLFFPGTLLHELSHAFMALLLFVPVGKMELLPKIQGNGVKLGSVAIARVDPIRRFFIGIAPFLFGVGILLGLLYVATVSDWWNNRWVTVLLLYIVFEIGNTLFSSKRDMEGALELLGVIVILVALWYLFGFPFPSLDPNIFFNNHSIQAVFTKGTYFLLVPIGIDLLVILTLNILLKKY